MRHFTNLTVTRLQRTMALMLTFCLLSASVALAMPPHPSVIEAQAQAKARGEVVASIPSTADLHARGICTPDDFFGLKTAGKDGRQGTAAALGTFRILAILVDFSDKPSQATPTFFDNLVFGGTTGTVSHYFDEISYNQIDLVTVNLPSSIGWNRAPQTYSYYVGGPGDYGMWGDYPNNSQKMVEELVDAVDAQVDFSLYDNDGNGYVDVLLVIHAGSGAELTQNAADMWSHKWGIDQRMTGEGVYVRSFTVQPEYWYSPGDMTIGVYAHELLHGFGLPDLYDTDNSSNGIGKWGIMSGGSWNGTLGNSPAHPSAWSRLQLGISTAVNVTANLNQEAIASVNGGGSIFRLWTSGNASSEYFLVENRQQTGYDAGLPGSGLLIWHIDDTQATNRNEWYPGQPASSHFKVAIVQSDGLYELEHKAGQGDNDDAWPGGLNRVDFNGATSPNSDGYGTGGSFVAVENISVSGATMNADLIVGIAAAVEDDGTILPDQFMLEQNYPNPFNPLTRIQFTVASGSVARLQVYNMLGQQVATLLDQFVSAGQNEVVWDATDDQGNRVASGAYFYRLTVNNTEETRKMILLK